MPKESTLNNPLWALYGEIFVKKFTTEGSEVHRGVLRIEVFQRFPKLRLQRGGDKFIAVTVANVARQLREGPFMCDGHDVKHASSSSSSQHPSSLGCKGDGSCGSGGCKNKTAVSINSSKKQSSPSPTDFDFRETLYTIGKDGKRHWVYNALVKGRLLQRRVLVVCALLLIYLGLPWVTVHGDQAVLLSIMERKFTFFGTTFYPTDTVLLFIIIAGLALTMFLASALLGRMWCGWACPQTVFLEFVFRPIERFIEGGPAQRLRLDSKPFSSEWVLKKGLKWTLYAVVAWLLASTALAYFWGRDNLIGMMQHSPEQNFFPFALTLVLMAVLLFEFGWFREQFCTVLCPYARFQSVLLDSNSLIVGYDPVRGEPRGKQNSAETTGDCIDCGLCVRVCPTGIDIRNGLQLECIQCSQCIDACDSVMEKVGRAPGLIRYDSERNLLRREGLTWVRPRVVVYAGFLLALGISFIALLSSRSLTDFKVVRGGADVPFSALEHGMIVNHLHARIGNKSNKTESYEAKMLGFSQGTLTVPQSPYPVGPGEEKTLPLFVMFPQAALPSGIGHAHIELKASDGSTKTAAITLLGPQAEGK